MLSIGALSFTTSCLIRHLTQSFVKMHAVLCDAVIETKPGVRNHWLFSRRMKKIVNMKHLWNSDWVSKKMLIPLFKGANQNIPSSRALSSQKFG